MNDITVQDVIDGFYSIGGVPAKVIRYLSDEEKGDYSEYESISN
ncbi:hypothetical protein [Robinsoniella peoriensis]|nr:hypothetical protein [Robinsoniella peoriensis]